jgi:hypothetical protein
LLFIAIAKVVLTLFLTCAFYYFLFLELNFKTNELLPFAILPFVIRVIQTFAFH